MNKSTLFLVVLSCTSHFVMAAPTMRPDNKATIDIQGEIQQKPSSAIRLGTPGILACPNQSKTTWTEKELLLADEHSRDCRQESTNGDTREKDVGTPMEYR